LGFGRNVKYDCLPFDKAIKQVAVMGVIVGPVLPCPISRPAGPGVTCDRTLLSTSLSPYFNPGRFDLRDFVIAADGANATTAKLLVLDYCARNKPGIFWSPICYATTSILKADGAVHYVIPKNSGALKFGLSSTTTTHSFEAAGPHLYVSPAGNEPGQTESTLYVGVADQSGSTSRTFSVTRYREGDLVSIYVWKDKIVFSKNGESIHMTPSPCDVDQRDCALIPFVSNHVNNNASTALYLQ
jgi:hypothetical protein